MFAFASLSSLSKTSVSLRRLAALLLLAPAFLLGRGASAQTLVGPQHQTAPAATTAAPAPKAATAPEAEEGAAPKNDAQHVGIKMHGHWTINVKNPDGTLVEHREFENSITIGGGNVLLALMTGFQIPGDYAVVLAPSSGTSPCLSSQNTPSTNECAIVRVTTTNPGSALCNNFYYCATGLTTNFVASNTQTPGTLTLAGSITANQTGTIGVVQTVLGTCFINSFNTTVETNAPSTCPVSGTNVNNQAYTGLSSATLSPVSVTNGQIIQVTVVISFS